MIRGTRAAVGVEDGVVRMWDVVWNSEESRFEEAAMRDSVRVHHAHVKNGVRKDNCRVGLVVWHLGWAVVIPLSA